MKYFKRFMNLIIIVNIILSMLIVVSCNSSEDSSGDGSATLSSNASLSNLVISGGGLTTAFSPTTFYYDAEITSDQFAITVFQGHSKQTIRVNDQAVMSGIPVGPLKFDQAEYKLLKISVTAEDGTVGVYIVKAIPQGTVAYLSGITLSGNIAYTPNFNKATTSYTGTVLNSVTSLQVKAIVEKSGSSLSIAKGATTYGTTSNQFSSDIPLVVGDNNITIKVTGENSSSTNTYTVNIVRESANSDYLSALVLSDSITYTPNFNKTTTSYAATVANSVTSFQVKATLEDANSNLTIKKQGSSTIYGTTSGLYTSSIPLTVGDNYINVTVQGDSSRTYVITVTRESNNVAYLSALSLSDSITFSPTFSKTTEAYSVNVDCETTSLKVKATVEDSSSNLSIKKDNNEYGSVSGEYSNDIPLTAGSNQIKIIVTAQGSASKEYTITVNRASNTNLSALTISDNITYTPTFSKTTKSYSATVDSSIDELKIKANVEETTSTIKIMKNSTEYGSTSGQYSDAIPIADGDNIISVEVKATNGDTSSYVLTVTKASFNGIKIYFQRPSNYGDAKDDKPWIWYDKDSDNKWETEVLGQSPGDMVYVTTHEGNKWYVKEVADTSSVTFLFNDGNDWNEKVEDNGNNFVTTQNIWVFSDGQYQHTSPFDKKPQIIVNPEGGYFDESCLSITVNIDSELSITSKTYTRDGGSPQTIVSPIQICDLNEGESTTLSFSATNADGTTTVGPYTYTKGSAPKSGLGAIYSKSSTTFSIWSPDSSNVKVVVDGTDYTCSKVPDFDGYSNVYSATVSGDLHLKEYQFKINGTSVRDPYGVMVKYGTGSQQTKTEQGASVTSDTGLDTNIVIDLSLTDPDGGWVARPALVEREDAIIYEVHVRDFTIDSSSGVSSNKRGKFLGMVETGATCGSVKTGIDHLKELGVTHVQILPFYDSATRNNHSTGQDYNWGYDPVNFNVPEDRYAADPEDYAGRVKELKTMINEFHKNGIRVIMDVVYNHTFWDEMFENISGQYYTGTNLSGCGNAVNNSVPMVSRFIQDSLEYWVSEYNIDGFRFDLIGIFYYEEVKDWGIYMNNKFPDRNLLIYGEPWCGGYDNIDPNVNKKVRLGKVPYLASAHIGVFNDRLRQALKGNSDNDGSINNGDYGAYIFNSLMDNQWTEISIERGIRASITSYKTTSILSGLWEQQFTADPEQTINYVSAHDNLCLWDKVKAAKGTGDYAKSIDMFAMGIILTAQGIPFIHAGDEMLRTKPSHSHNSYMWGDQANKIDWNWKSSNSDVFNYYKGLIAIRNAHPGFRMNTWDEVNNYVQTSRAGNGVVIADINASSNGDSWNKIKVVYNSGSDYTMSEGGWTKVWGDGSGNTCKGTAITIFKQ